MANVLPQIARLKGTALDFLFPRRCVGCGKEGSFLCQSCRQLLNEITPPVCPRCGLPRLNGKLCHVCADRQLEIDGIRSPFKFDGVMRQAIHQLKYQNLRALAAPLAELLREYLLNNHLPAEVLIPVPLHQKRLRERGYNQSGLLARELGRLISLPVVDDCLIRQKYTSAQARTDSLAERSSNVDGAFACLDSRMQDKRVLLIDDVSTSGATLDACAAALKAAGAAQVRGLVLAREI